MRRLILLFTLVGALGSAAAAGAEVASNTVVPIDVTVVVPCTGDLVELSGHLHVLVTETVNKDGVSGREQFQPQGVTGTDLTNGAPYQGTGGTATSFRVSLMSGQAQTSFVNDFQLVGQGSAANYRVHAVTRMTFNVDGRVTADVSILDIWC